MTSQSPGLPRRNFLTAATAVGVGAVALNGLGAPRARAATSAGAGTLATTPVSYVDTSLARYDRPVLMVDGAPFFHNGVQFRYEKHKITYGWTDAQLEPVLKMASDDGFTIVNMSLWWSQIEPTKDTFDWTELERYINLCNKYKIKLELLWFGTDSGGSSVGQGPRLPSYVTTDYQWVVDSTGTRVTNGGKSLLDKTDPSLLAREKYVLGKLLEHLASYDTAHALVGIQILNEPNVSSVWGKQVGRSYSSYSTQLWNAGGYTSEAQFRNDVLLNYLSELGRVVKESQHSVWTRCNVIGDAKPVAENEAKRQQGQVYLDFFGDDPYTEDQDRVYWYGTKSLFAQGKNFRMIMENFAGADLSDVLKFNAIAGNAVMNMYAVLDPDAATGSGKGGLYNFDPVTKVVTRKAVTYRVAALNHMLNKTPRDLAKMAPVEAGGSTLQTFNRKAAQSVDLAKPLDGTPVTYRTSVGGQAIVAKTTPTEFTFLSTQAGQFEIPGTLQSGGVVENGYFDARDYWVKTSAKSYTTTATGLSFSVAAGDCVRVALFKASGAAA